MVALSFCPFPHTSRDQAWILVGVGLGIGLYKVYDVFSKQKRQPECGARVVQPVKVVNMPERDIFEYEGALSTENPDISLAKVTIKKPCKEGPQRNAFDEWLFFLSGKAEIICHDEDSKAVEVIKGDVVYLPANTYTYNFIDTGTVYIPICVPSFSSERVDYNVNI